MPQSEVYAIKGIRLSTVAAGIRYPNRKDLVLFEIDEGATVSGVFTQNIFAAAPVLLCREHLAVASPRYLLINTGNANAGTGDKGLNDARQTCEALATLSGVIPAEILPFSTGVTTEFLPTQPIIDHMEVLLDGLGEASWTEAATGIMTTDTVPKALGVRFEIGGEVVTISGMTKGSGMIRPNMATMLSYIATDAAIAKSSLDKMLQTAMAQSFNRITVDGDTSTNDSCVLIATGKGKTLGGEKDEAIFLAQLIKLVRDLAQMMVRDAEGASKFVTITVSGGASSQDCLQVAYRIAHSPLVKTAFASGDANLGRIMVAIGNAEVAGLQADAVTMHVGGVRILHHGIDPAYVEAKVVDILKQPEFEVCVDLGMGTEVETVWTCDLTHEYISINADYRS